MKTVSMRLVLGMLSLVCAIGAQADGSASADEKAVTAMEDTWAESQRTNNPDLIAPHLSDGIVGTGSDGKVMDKAALLESARKTKYLSVTYPDVKVRVFGDTAIATGGFVAEGTNANGKPFAPERWTDTWIRMPDGSWKCVATHSSPITD